MDANNAKKEYQLEVILRLEFMISEKLNILTNRHVLYSDIVELDILNEVLRQFKHTFELSTEDVPFEILAPWMTVNIYKELLKLYQTQTKLNDEEYNLVLDIVMKKLFIKLFPMH